ncbi:phosphomevalonate kinase ERG8-like [Arachis duranensis]|uniref:Phosphomevalonate kinase ERG8-like n=1 Tax=Arachis duranensis TaxID=130453 RepID=A0A9C6WQ12_ARADU|nr:phosphomevalonate kinase ERG8-like [Arachis duranensis]
MEHLLRRYKAVGIRLDSGDLAYLSCQARKIFCCIEKEFAVSGFGKTSITASNDLNEETLDALNKQIMDNLTSFPAYIIITVHLGIVLRMARLIKDGSLREQKSSAEPLQVETNEALFGVKSTFNEELYTTKLEKGPQTRELEKQALRIAREIEDKETQDLHLAEIEPESQTKLLDATLNLEGVLLAGVPGAGGFDAVFAVTLGDSSSNVTKIWSSLNVLALLVKENPCGVSLESVDPRTNEITLAVSSIHIE